MYDVCSLDVDCYFHQAAICAICVTILNIKQGMSIFLWKIYPVPISCGDRNQFPSDRGVQQPTLGGSPVLAARRINIMTGRALNILIGQVLLALHCTAGSRNNSVPLMPSPTQLQLHNNVMIVIVILIVTCSLTYIRILDTLTNTHMHTHRPHKGISSV